MMLKTIVSRRSALVLLSLALIGCGGGGGGGGTNGRVATVIGIVKDSLLGDRGVSGATIAFGTVSGTTATTEQAAASGGTVQVGAFQLSNVAVGASTATVTLPGGDVQTVAFYPPIGAGTNADVEIVVNIGQVRGRVLGSDGKPVAGASIYLTADGPTDAATSLADGSFLIQNVQPGSVGLTAVFGTQTATKTLTIGKGVTEAGDIALVNDPNPNPIGTPRTLFGTVTLAPGGEKAPGTTVILFRGGVQFESATTDAQGNYQFYVPIGGYTLRTLRDSYVDQEVAVTLVDANRPLQQDLVLKPR